MKLPNAGNVIIEREKIAGYLLNLQHRLGGSKARFFFRFGFSLERPEQLETALREYATRCEVVVVTQTGFGPRFEVDGELATPDGRNPRVRTIWQLENGEIAPRLLTAYPF